MHDLGASQGFGQSVVPFSASFLCRFLPLFTEVEVS